MGFSLKKKLKNVYEVLTPQNEQALRAGQRSIEAANQRINAGGNNNFGVLANLGARQQFTAQQQAPTFNLRDTLARELKKAIPQAPVVARDFGVAVAREVPKGVIRVANTVPRNATPDPVINAGINFLQQPLGFDRRVTDRGPVVTPTNPITKKMYGTESIVNAPEDAKELVKGLTGKNLPGAAALPLGLALNNPFSGGAKAAARGAKSVVKKQSPPPNTVGQTQSALPVSPQSSTPPPVDPIKPVQPQSSGDDIIERVSSQVEAAAKANKERYAPATKMQRLKEINNPYQAGAKLDAQYAKATGTPMRDIPRTESMEALAEGTRLSNQASESFLRKSKTAPVVQKYGTGTPDEAQFNTYRLFMRDLEQRADGRKPLFRDRSDTEMDAFVRQYEARNPTARQELLAAADDVRQLQDMTVKEGVISADELASARTKKNGGEYQFYTPAQRALPEELERMKIGGSSVGNIGRQRILQDLKGSDIPLDPTFNALTDYSNVAFRQIAQARTAQKFAERVQQGLVPNTTFVQTPEREMGRQALLKKRRAGETVPKNDYAEFVPDPTTGKQIITGRKDGVNFKIETTPEYARFLQGLDQEEMNAALKFASALQSPIRAGLTGVLNPPFAIVNSVWNTMMAPILSPQGLRVFGPRAIAAAFRSFNSNDQFQEALFAKGAQRFTGSLQTSKKVTTADALAAQKDIGDKLKFYMKNPRAVWSDLDVVGARLDRAARTGVASAARDARLRKGGNMDTAIADAAYAFNNTLPNFGRQSPFVRQTDAVAMYAGASQAGTRALLTAWKRDPVGVTARFSVATGALISAVAYNMQRDESQAFYEDMVNSGKGYLLDNNVIIVMPGAKKDPKTGQWSGVKKIPIAPELRPINSAVWKTFSSAADEAKVGVKDYAVALTDFFTGGLRTVNNPVANLAAGLATGKDPRSGFDVVSEDQKDLPKQLQGADKASKFAKTVAKGASAVLPGEVSPAEVDYVARSTGLPGKLLQKGDPLTNTGKSLTERFEGAKGTSSAGQYFKAMEGASKGLAGADAKNFRALFSKSIDGQGKALPPTDEGDLQKYGTLANNDRIRKAYAEGQKSAAKANGQEVDPLYLLSDEQQKVYYKIHALPYKSEEATVLQNRNKWYDDFQKEREGFFEKLPEGNFASANKPASQRVAYPKFDPKTEALLDQAASADGSQRAELIANNPNLQNAYDKISRYTNDKRISQGFVPFKEYPKADADTQAIIKTYNALPKGDGKKGGNASRNAWIKANPDKYAKMQDYFAATAVHQLANNAGLAKFEGEELNQKALKATYSLGNYSIVEKKNEDGSKTYALDPQAASAEKASRSSGSSAGGGGGAGGKRFYASKGGRSRGGRSATIRVKKARFSKGKTVKVAKAKAPKTVKIKRNRSNIKRVKRTQT